MAREIGLWESPSHQALSFICIHASGLILFFTPSASVLRLLLLLLLLLCFALYHYSLASRSNQSAPSPAIIVIRAHAPGLRLSTGP